MVVVGGFGAIKVRRTGLGDDDNRRRDRHGWQATGRFSSTLQAQLQGGLQCACFLE